ncbi:LAFA_0G24564g1_1 [Lachancea sp. 'fantastica']|nr:LAFA_0G24564g1_1 [Lachancea sp. 'fantastica']
MKVFVTGASGFVGGALIPELIESGHKVVALARSDQAEQKIQKLSSDIEIVRGSLQDLEVLEKAAAASDGVIHLGFLHDFSKFEEACLVDRKATVAMLEALKGTNKPYVQTTGTLMFAPGVLATETTDKSGSGLGSLRSETEDIVLSYKDKGVRALEVRLSPTVHGKGDQGFIPALIQIAKKSGKSGYIGDGSNVWPAVSRWDAGCLFRLVLEKGRAGAVYHAVAEEGVKTRDIAEAIGEL